MGKYTERHVIYLTTKLNVYPGEQCRIRINKQDFNHRYIARNTMNVCFFVWAIRLWQIIIGSLNIPPTQYSKAIPRRHNERQEDVMMTSKLRGIYTFKSQGTWEYVIDAWTKPQVYKMWASHHQITLRTQTIVYIWTRYAAHDYLMEIIDEAAMKGRKTWPLWAQDKEDFQLHLRPLPYQKRQHMETVGLAIALHTKVSFHYQALPKGDEARES